MDCAVILAAGLGERLGALEAARPKGFIELGGKPIIETSLDKLAAAGIVRTVIVTGYRADFYERLARRRRGIELVHNPSYAESGSMYSLYLARERLPADFLLLESDLIYERRALDVVLAAVEPNTLLVSGPTLSGDEVYVEAYGDRLTGLSKNKSALQGTVIGELVGITRLSARCLAAMAAHGERVFCETLRLDYEQALVAAAREVRVACPVIADLVWSEIDDPNHLQRAQSLIWPAIVERDGETAQVAAAHTRITPPS